MIYKHSSDIKEDFIADVLRIDAKVFKPSDQGTENSIRERYNANKDSYIFALHNYEIVGYVCFFPITEEFSKKINSEEKAFDDDIRKEDIRSDYPTGKDAKFDLFLISCAVLPEYQEKGIGVELMNRFFSFVSDKIQNGSRIRNMYSYTFTNPGAWLLDKYAFSEVKYIKQPDSSTGIRLMRYSFDDFSQANMFLFVPFFIDAEIEKSDLGTRRIKTDHPFIKGMGKTSEGEFKREFLDNESELNRFYIITMTEEEIKEEEEEKEREKQEREKKEKEKEKQEKEAVEATEVLKEEKEVSQEEETKDIPKFEPKKETFIIIDEEGNPLFKGMEFEFEFFVSCYNSFYIAILKFDSLGIDPSILLNQTCMNELRINDKMNKEEEGFEFREYLANSLNLNSSEIKPAGKIRCITSLVQKPTNIHMEYLLACESYTESAYPVTHRLTSPEITKRAQINFAQYNSNQIYASENNIVYIVPANEERPTHEFLIIFIMELIMFQLCAIYSAYNEITDALALNEEKNSKEEKKVERRAKKIRKQKRKAQKKAGKPFQEERKQKKIKKPSLDIVERVNRRFCNAAKLWDVDNFTYLAAKQIYEGIAKVFNIEKVKDEHKLNFDVYEKLAKAESEKKTQTIIFILTVLSGFSAAHILVNFIIEALVNPSIISVLTTLIDGLLIIFACSIFFFAFRKPILKLKSKKKKIVKRKIEKIKEKKKKTKESEN